MTKQKWTLIDSQLSVQTSQVRFVAPHPEHHYAFFVLRLQPQTYVEMTNCCGVKAQGVILEANKKHLLIQVIEVFCAAPRTVCVQLWLALPKPSLLQEIVASSSECGVQEIHLFKGEKSLKTLCTTVEKLQKISNEASRVSKSAFAAQIFWYKNLEEFYIKFIQKSIKNNIFTAFCDETLTYCPSNTLYSVLQNQNTQTLNFHTLSALVGPEAGFSDKERCFIAQKMSFCTRVSLGPHILRVPHAVLSAVAVMLGKCWAQEEAT
jgi:RsmE family RNA methyltransferase